MRTHRRVITTGVAVRSVLLSWVASDGADSYWLEIGTTQGSGNVFNADLQSGSLTYSPTLAAGNYYWRVFGVAAGIKGDVSDEGYFVVS